MSRIKTLSDDIDVSVSTSTLVASGTSGYVQTKIYQDSIGVFTGQSYVVGGTDLIVNINDIASQNDYKKDYLKLQTNGELKSDPMIYNMIGVKYRFNRGAISNYKANIYLNGNAAQSDVDVLCGYDYVNKDLQPRCVADLPQYAWDTSLCRLMTGCQWIWIPDEDMGRFTNSIPDEALPHYPFKYTDKYGIGLSLWHGGDGSKASYYQTEFSIRLTVGEDYNLGTTPFVTSNTTFCTLDDFLSNLGTHEFIDSDYNSSIYLKQYDTSGDAFGDYEEGYDGYYGTLRLNSLTVYGNVAHGTITVGTFTSGAIFNDYLLKYMQVVDTGWDYNALVNGERIIFTTPTRRNQSRVTKELNDVESDFPVTSIRETAAEESLFPLGMSVQPNFTQNVYDVVVPDKYIGNCLIGILDRCPARYYLAWNDRYGDIQSQPFDGKIEYTEDIETEEIMDYKLRRKVSYNSVQPKWKLNTKWLKDEVYPIYESIYTSPYLLLYDSEQDKAWNVIITDKKYSEKTYKNDKMFNLTIEVEANKTQNIMY